MLLLVPGLAVAQKHYPFLVKGKVGQLGAPAKIYLLSGPNVLDSVALTTGAFELKGTTQWPKSAVLVLARQGKLGDASQAYLQAPDRISLFLSPEPVSVTSADSLANARVVGGPQLAAYQRLDAATKPFTAKFRVAHPKEEEAALEKQYTQTISTFIKDNPTAWVSLELFQVFQMQKPSPRYEEVSPLYEALTPEMQNSPPGRFYGDIVRSLKAAAIGAEAPNFTQTTPRGRAVSLSDYRGKYLLLNFWASWCSTCRQENPAIIKTYTTYKNRNFDILSVSLDKEELRDLWVQAIADDHLPWAQVSDLRGLLNEAAMLYGVDTTSKNFLIDPAGKIVATNLHGDELEATLAKLIK